MEKKELTGYASIDNPQSIEATFLERNPIIPSVNIYTLLKLLSKGKLDNPAVDCLDLKANYGTLLNDSVSILFKKYPFELDEVTLGQTCLEKIRNDEKFDLIIIYLNYQVKIL